MIVPICPYKHHAKLYLYCIYIVLTSTKLPSQQENIHPFTFLNKAYSLGEHLFFFFKAMCMKKENFSIILACSFMLLARTKTSASCSIRLLGDFVNSEAARVSDGITLGELPVLLTFHMVQKKRI